MFKRLLIPSVLIYFVFVLGLLYAETPKFKPTPQAPFKTVYDIAITAMWLDENCQLCAKLENKGNFSIKKDLKGEVWAGEYFLYPDGKTPAPNLSSPVTVPNKGSFDLSLAKETQEGSWRVKISTEGESYVGMSEVFQVRKKPVIDIPEAPN